MKKIVLALVLAGATSVAAHAAEMDFATVDADGDGVVTLEEATAAGWEWTEEQFGVADTDGDGGLSAEEFAAAANG